MMVKAFSLPFVLCLFFGITAELLEIGLQVLKIRELRKLVISRYCQEQKEKRGVVPSIHSFA